MHARIARSLVVPSTLAVVMIGCSNAPPTNMPGPCVRGYAVPAGLTTPPAGTRPMVDLAPCSPTFNGEFTCTTAAGCTVVYGDGPPNPGDPATTVFCPTTTECLFGLTAAGAPQYGPCPTVEVPNQLCSNRFELRNAQRSGFACSSTASDCTISGTTGQRVAFVTRSIDGTVDASACPTPCSQFS